MLPGGLEQVEGHVSIQISPKIRANLTAGGKFHVVVIFLFVFFVALVVVALLGLLGDRSEVGRVGRHGELFLDAGDGHGTSDSAGFCFDWEDIPSLSFSSVCLFLHRALPGSTNVKR